MIMDNEMKILPVELFRKLQSQIQFATVMVSSIRNYCSDSHEWFVKDFTGRGNWKAKNQMKHNIAMVSTLLMVILIITNKRWYAWWDRKMNSTQEFKRDTTRDVELI